MREITQLSKPSICDVCCSSNVELSKEPIVKTTLKNGSSRILWAWCCNDCEASVACHEGTNIPMGKMADKHTRTLRAYLHRIFDELWLKGYMSRPKAYSWLSSKLGLEPCYCHISWLSKAQLLLSIEAVKALFSEELDTLKSRRSKQNAKRKARATRERDRETVARKLHSKSARKFRSKRKRKS